MSYSKDYEDIRVIIDEIVGIDTQQGSNLKMAIKKYFELKPKNIKLVSDKNLDYTYQTIHITESKDAERDAALDRYTDNIKKGIEKMKTKGEYCGVRG